jgi:drug/metabolite transporter (DMT)-like permease
MNDRLLVTSGRERYKAIALLIIAAILWSSGGLLIKSVSWNPIAIAGARSAVAALLLIAFIRRPRFTWSLTQIGGAVAYTVTVLLFVAANKLTTAANAILLQYSSPAYVALLGARFLGERATGKDWVTIAVVIGGMALFFLDDLAAGGLWGNACAILSGATFATLVILLRKQKDSSPLESVLLGNVLTSLVSVPFVLDSRPDPSGWATLGFLGVFQLGLPYILYSRAIRHVSALDAILIPAIEPMLSPLWVFLVIGEAPGTWALLGGIIILASVTIRCAISTT